MNRDPVLGEEIIWSGKPRVIEVPRTFRVAALVLFATGYWGVHAAIYGTEQQQADGTRPKTTHTYNPDHPHPAPGAPPGAPPGKP